MARRELSLNVNHMLPRWVIWTLFTLVSWGIWAILGKEIGNALSPEHSQLLSTIGLLPVLLAIVFIPEQPARGNRALGEFLAFGAGFVSSLGNVFFYELLNGGGKAATVIPLTALAPLVTVLLAVPVLEERLNRVQLIGVVLSLAAIYMFSVKDERGLISSWVLVALAPIGLWGLAGLLQKMATNYISARSAAIWFLVAFFPLAGWILWREPWPFAVSTRTWVLAAALGFTLAFGNFTVLLAFASGGKASIIAPLSGLYPLISIPIAIVRYDERIGWREGLAIVLALAAVVTLSLESPAAADEGANPSAENS